MQSNATPIAVVGDGGGEANIRACDVRRNLSLADKNLFRHTYSLKVCQSMSKCLQKYAVHITVHVSRTAVFHDDSPTNTLKRR